MSQGMLQQTNRVVNDSRRRGYDIIYFGEKKAHFLRCALLIFFPLINAENVSMNENGF